jgi:hypothetical protein
MRFNVKHSALNLYTHFSLPRPMLPSKLPASINPPQLDLVGFLRLIVPSSINLSVFNCLNGWRSSLKGFKHLPLSFEARWQMLPVY